MKKLGVLILALLLLSGCGKAAKLEGEVTAKDHQASYVMVIPVTISDGKTTSIIPTTYFIPDCFEIEVAGPHPGSACVNESVYNELEIGETYRGTEVKPEDQKQECDECEAP